MKFIAIAFVACIAVASAASLPRPSDDERSAQTLKNTAQVNPDSYNWEYETSNGISANEQGQSKQIGSESPIVSQGRYSYTDKSTGQVVSVDYVANEQGFQPQSSLLPTPPEIPPQIARALEWLAAHPQPLEKN